MEQLLIDGINQRQLDFDQERICSVSLTRDQLVICLTCSRIFSRFGEHLESTPAYLHALDSFSNCDQFDDPSQYRHRLFMDLIPPNPFHSLDLVNNSTLRVWLFPEGRIFDHHHGGGSVFFQIYRAMCCFIDTDDADQQTQISTRSSSSNSSSNEAMVSIASTDAGGYLAAVLSVIFYSSTISQQLLMHLQSHPVPYTIGSLRDALLESFCRVRCAAPLRTVHVPYQVMFHLDRASNGRFNSTKRIDPEELLLFLLHTLPSSQDSLNMLSFLKGLLSVTDQPLDQSSSAASSISTAFTRLTVTVPSPPLFKDQPSIGQKDTTDPGLVSDLQEMLRVRYGGINSLPAQRLITNPKSHQQMYRTEAIISLPSHLLLLRFDGRCDGLNSMPVQFPCAPNHHLEIHSGNGTKSFMLTASICREPAESLNSNDSYEFYVQFVHRGNWYEWRRGVLEPAVALSVRSITTTSYLQLWKSL